MITNFPLGHLKISQGDLKSCVSRVESAVRNHQKTYCLPLNLTKYVVSKDDLKLRKVINSADIVIADGAPIYWFGRRLGYRGVRRISGIEMAEAILAGSKSHDWRVFLLGARPENLERAVGYARTAFSDPIIAGFHHGYFHPDEVDRIIDSINASRADILFLAMGMPQKEYFIADYYDRIDAVFWLPVGGAIDIWSQAKKRSNPLLTRLGLEWLQRSLYDRKKAKAVLKYGIDFAIDFLIPR